MPSDSTLTLFIPDLFGFQSTLSKLSQDERSQLPEIKLPILEKWLSRGLVEKYKRQEASVFSEFGLSIENDTDKHHAALSLFAEDTSAHQINKKAYWLRADPVNMQPDRDTALLTAHEELALTQDEANKLVEEINKHFADEPWQFYAFAPHRWYLRLDNPINLKTHALAKVLGDDINQFMPSGDDADYWFNITNEIQMLLYGTNVNFERDSRNMLMANSIWLWGGGDLPEPSSEPSYDKVITNNTLFSGLGYYCDCEVLPLGESFSRHIEENKNFVVLDVLSEHVQRRDLYTFVQQLNAIDSEFLLHCNQLLENKKINTIKLMTDNGITRTVTRKQLHHWWKRIKPFTGFKYA